MISFEIVRSRELFKIVLTQMISYSCSAQPKHKMAKQNRFIITLSGPSDPKRLPQATQKGYMRYESCIARNKDTKILNQIRVIA